MRLPTPACLRREIDNLASPPLLDHPPSRCLAAPEQSLAIDIEDEVPILFGRLEEGNDFPDAGVVDEDVHAPERLYRRVHHLLHLGLVADVNRHRDSLPAGSMDLIGHRLRAFEFEIGNDDFSSLLGVAEADSAANPLCATRDNRHLTLKTHA